ncbi:uncharacterized protein LOC101849887 [Aplysia californica]|uniref:Uncharacterized protein LOC101849887 n=1 Tax=Aplysia californica TaxID=6500 RepID=A0ABM0K6M9_APLCA|nr:uncharacterized protein LOC101849887 [Aplysia californica]
MARDVIVHYKSLLTPETKLRFGVAYCMKNQVEHTGPDSELSHLLMTTENLQHASGVEPIGTHDSIHLPDGAGYRAENTPYPVFEVTDIRSSAGSCLKTVGSMFDNHGHDKSAKMVILVATQKSWADPRHVEEAAALKGPTYNATLAVIAAGVQSRDTVDMLRSLASDPSKFMSANSTNDIHDVPNKLTQGSCQLLNVDLSTPSFPVSTIDTPDDPPQTCKRISDNTFEIRTHMGPLGYVLERRYCELEHLFDVATCTCPIEYVP